MSGDFFICIPLELTTFPSPGELITLYDELTPEFLSPADVTICSFSAKSTSVDALGPSRESNYCLAGNTSITSTVFDLPLPPLILDPFRFFDAGVCFALVMASFIT